MNKRTTLMNVYGPSDRDNPDFFENVCNVLNRIGNENIIIGGDWNCILDMRIDSRNYANNNNNRPRTLRRIKELMSEYNLIDIFRELYPNKKSYTWRRFNTAKQGRLDYFLISDETFGTVKKCTINPGYRSDHSMVTL